MQTYDLSDLTSYLDDLVPGTRFVTAAMTITESQIIDFARNYDPQIFHLDVESARESTYGGLIASGFHTISLMFRLFIGSGIFARSSMGSPGIDELRWLAPVRPGDTLHVEAEIIEVIPSRSKPDRGIARIRYEGINQQRQIVASFITNHLLLRRTETHAI